MPDSRINSSDADSSGGHSTTDTSPGAGHRQRLRERFERSGLDGFSDHEVLELLLTLCIPRKDVKEPAKALMTRFGSLRGVLDAPSEQLQELNGIGEVAPVALHIIREAATLYLRESAEEGSMLDSTDALKSLFRIRLGGLRHEAFEVAFLDKSYQLIRNGIERLEDGVADRTRVYPAKVMRAALLRHAVYIVVAHNHPSGQLKASPEDIRLTKALAESAKALELQLLDHIIVTPSDALSFLDEGLL